MSRPVQPVRTWRRYLLEDQPEPFDPTDVAYLRKRMPNLSPYCSDAEMLAWGRSLARAYKDA